MDDLIALHCPACGGNIQIEANLEKIYCTHCGTQLLLKHGADGLLMPLQARDLNASARMQETEATLLMMATLETQVEELEAQVHALRVAFWTQVMLGGVKKRVGYIYSETDAMRRINQYTRQVTGSVVIDLRKFQLRIEDQLEPNRLARSNITGLTTPNELLALYQWLVQPKGYDKTAQLLATTLFPISALAPDIETKKVRLKQVAYGLFDEFMRSDER